MIKPEKPVVQPQKASPLAKSIQPVQPVGHDTDDSFYVWTSPFVFRLCWFGFFLFHSVCFTYLAISAHAYEWLPKTVLSVTLQSNGISIDRTHFPFIAVCMALLSGLHGFAIVTMVGFSLWYRRFTYIIADDDMAKLMERIRPKCTGKDVHQQEPSKLRNLVNNAVGLAESVFGRRGIFGIEGRHFVTVFLLREVLETVLQGYQAYRLSAYVPQPWLVRGFVGMLIVSCWSTPLIHRVFGSDTGIVRVSCLVLDVFFDFFSTVVIPSVLVVPYISQYQPQVSNFPVPLLRTSRWRALMTNEFRLIVVSSWIDLFSRVTLSISTVSVLFDVKILLRLKTTKPHLVLSAIVRDETHVETKAHETGPSNRVLGVGAKQTHAGVIHRFHQIIQLIIAIFGFVVLVLHIKAESYEQTTGCVLPVVPWDSGQSGCAYIALNCTTLKITGTSDEVTELFSCYDPNSLQMLDFFSCPDLHIPPTLQTFHQLASFKVIKTTISEWNADAALTHEHHPSISYFEAAGVQMPRGELPPGLIDDDFPQTLRTIYVNDTNVAKLPSKLATVWPKGLIFIFQFAKLTEFPPMVADMSIVLLSLAGNQIESMPPEAFYTSMMEILELSGNPITSFPDIPNAMITARGVPGPTLKLIDMTLSGLSRAPLWLEGRSLKLIAAGSPICDRIAANDLTANEAFQKTFVDCATLTKVGYGS